MTGKVFIHDQLIIDPGASSLTLVYGAMPLLSGATAAVNYRSGGRQRYLSIRGRDMTYGDNLSSIRRGRLKYLKQVLPSYGRAAIPLDLFEKEMPSLLALPVETDWGQWLVVGLVNWADRTTETTIELADLELPQGRYHVYNYWRRRYLGTVEGRLAIKRHQPHETVLLLIKPVSDRPELFTSTFHVTQGGVEVSGIGWHGTWQKGRTLVVELEKAGRQRGELLFAVPGPYRVREVRLDGRRRGFKQMTREVISLGFSLRDRARVELDFER